MMEIHRVETQIDRCFSFCRETMSTSILLPPPLTMTSVFTAELVNKYSKDIKSVRNRIVQGLNSADSRSDGSLSFFFSGIPLVSSQSLPMLSTENPWRSISSSPTAYSLEKWACQWTECRPVIIVVFRTDADDFWRVRHSDRSYFC